MLNKANNINGNIIGGFMLYEALLIPQLCEEPNGTQITPPELNDIIFTSAKKNVYFFNGIYFLVNFNHMYAEEDRFRYSFVNSVFNVSFLHGVIWFVQTFPVFPRLFYL